MSTSSLRRDHDLIEKVMKAMEATIQLLKNGKSIPEPILSQVIDFTTNFTDVCHHTKEEKSFFPALERSGMPSNMGPIAMMLMEHDMSRAIGKKMETSTKQYLSTGDSTQLIADMQEYVEHITQHLWKENNRLFVMAEARLQYVARQVHDELSDIESKQLDVIGKSRDEYEKIAENLTKETLNSNSN